MKKKLNNFHKLLLIMFLLHASLFAMTVGDVKIGCPKSSAPSTDLSANKFGGFISPVFVIFVLSTFFLMPILFIAGCIKAKRTKQTKTISFLLLSLILFLYSLPFPAIFLLIIPIALTRKYWEVGDEGEAVSDFTELDPFHKATVFLSILYILSRLILALALDSPPPQLAIMQELLVASIPIPFLIGIVRAKRLRKAKTLDFITSFFLFFVVWFFAMELGASFFVAGVGIAMLLTKRWWEVKS